MKLEERRWMGMEKDIEKRVNIRGKGGMREKGKQKEHER